MNNPVTSSDITLLNTLAACANMTPDEVFKDFKIMANKKILKKSSDFILRSKKSKTVRISHWKSYIQNGSYTKEITLL